MRYELADHEWAAIKPTVFQVFEEAHRVLGGNGALCIATDSEIHDPTDDREQNREIVKRFLHSPKRSNDWIRTSLPR